MYIGDKEKVFEIELIPIKEVEPEKEVEEEKELEEVDG